MVGPLTWKNSTALPEKTAAEYFLAIDTQSLGGYNAERYLKYKELSISFEPFSISLSVSSSAKDHLYSPHLFATLWLSPIFVGTFKWMRFNPKR